MHRRPIDGLTFSAESYFAAMRAAMPADIAVRVHVVPFRSSGILRRIGNIVDVARLRGDVVHITGDIHYVGLGRSRRRSALTVLDCGTAHSPSFVARSLFRFLWLWLPTRRAARVIAISDITADQVAELAGVARGGVAVVPVTIDDAFVPAPNGVQSDRPIVLCVGTTANKNLAGSIAALQGLDVRLHIIGSLDDVTSAQLLASGVTFTNEVGLSDTAVRGCYVRADLVLFPSTYEGFGMPIVEAQATGRPVVTSDRAPMNEVAGAGACLVDPDDVASIRSGVERVLRDAAYREELVEAGFRNRERFRPQVAAEAYARMYREMAGN